MAGKSKRHRNSFTSVQIKGEMAMHDLTRAKQLRDSAEIRLQKDVTEIESQEVSSIVSIRRDQRLLKEKLMNVRQSTGYFKQNGKNSKGHRRKPFPNDGNEPATGASITEQERPRLPSLLITDNDKEKSKHIEEDALEINSAKARFQLKNRSSSVEEEPNKTLPNQTYTLPEMRKLSKSANTLHNNAWYANLEDVRSTINQRLSISMNDLSRTNSEKALEPYLYAPPDGLPRTMYLMPSMDERFKQAMKARYIRKPGTKIDPIERELNINEIFDSNKNMK